MKKATKIAFGAVAVLAVSAGVAGVTTYTLMQSRQDKNLSFYDEFQTASNVRYAALDATSMQPIDLTKAAESSLNSVVHIMSVQRSKVKTIQSQPDIFDFFFVDGTIRICEIYQEMQHICTEGMCQIHPSICPYIIRTPDTLCPTHT